METASEVKIVFEGLLGREITAGGISCTYRQVVATASLWQLGMYTASVTHILRRFLGERVPLRGSSSRLFAIE